MFVNPYAAIPSMHCAFALMIGVSGALVSRHTLAQALWCVYPLFVFFVVIVTGNHFWLDGAIGWVVAGLAALGAMQLARARPAAWSWRPGDGLSTERLRRQTLDRGVAATPSPRWSRRSSASST